MIFGWFLRCGEIPAGVVPGFWRVAQLIDGRIAIDAEGGCAA